MEFAPMLATANPFRADDALAYEVKWDGVRCIAYVTPERVTLLNRSGNDITSRFPELQGLSACGVSVVLDGEIIALSPDGKPDFSLVQRRTAKVPNLAIPIRFQIFDVLEINGMAATGLTYRERRDLLGKIDLDGCPAANLGVVAIGAVEGEALWQKVQELGLEGLVAKPLHSKYYPGRRDPWMKMKVLHRQEFVILGFTEGEGRRAGMVGALVLGYYQDGELVYAGKCGTGFDDYALNLVGGKLAELAPGSPLRGFKEAATWVEPLLVAEVEFAEWTRDRILRFPSFKGLRDDKLAIEVTANA